jgi:hypothetical protein
MPSKRALEDGFAAKKFSKFSTSDSLRFEDHGITVVRCAATGTKLTFWRAELMNNHGMVN